MTNAKYTDFDEYIRQGEPDKKEKASIWRIFCDNLRNRYLNINATTEWKSQPNLADPTSTQQVPNK